MALPDALAVSCQNWQQESEGAAGTPEGRLVGHWCPPEATPYNAGLFHNGAAFGDDEFLELYRRVAQAILRSIPGGLPKA